MKRLFVSYSRANKADVHELTRRLAGLGYQVWVDSSLHGGQSWWDEVLRQIAECDAFIAIVSRDSLNSVACQRELEWALALGKSVLPVAVEHLMEALPREISTRQIVDYSEPTQDAAYALFGALTALPPQPPRPDVLPEPPAAPLSYLTDLIEQVTQPAALTQQQQRQILTQLQPALRSADPEEQQGAQYVLDRFSRRDDLYADVNGILTQVLRAESQDPAQETTPTEVLSAWKLIWMRMRAPVQVAALAFGLLFLLWRITEYLPAEPLVNGIHLFAGIAGVGMAWTAKISKVYLIVFGIAFALLGITAFAVVVINTSDFAGPLFGLVDDPVDTWLNILLGLAMLMLGWLLPRITVTASTHEFGPP